MIEERDDAAVVGRPDQPPDRLDDARHPGHHERVLEAALEPVVVVALEPCLLQCETRQAGTDHRHRAQHLARVVDALGEDAARHRQQQEVAGER